MMDPNARDRITQALMNIQHPPPVLQVPPMPGRGMNMPAVATPGTMAGMNAQSPASPSFGGAGGMGQPIPPPNPMQQMQMQQQQPPQPPPGQVPP